MAVGKREEGASKINRRRRCERRKGVIVLNRVLEGGQANHKVCKKGE